ncbi:MAG: hypothetical protein AABW73_01735 [Nanoarchaeota archaeon]
MVFSKGLVGKLSIIPFLLASASCQSPDIPKPSPPRSLSKAYDNSLGVGLDNSGVVQKEVLPINDFLPKRFVSNVDPESKLSDLRKSIDEEYGVGKYDVDMVDEGLGKYTILITPVYVDPRVLVEVDKLSVNTDNSYREVFTGSQNDIEKQMMDLCETSNFEEAWVHFPKVGKTYENGVREDNRFVFHKEKINVPKKELRDGLETLVNGEKYDNRVIRWSNVFMEEGFLISKAASSGLEAVQYHHHFSLNISAEQIVEQVVNNRKDSGHPQLTAEELGDVKKKADLHVKDRDNYVFSVSSVSDLRIIVGRSLRFKRKYPEGKLSFRVVSTRGVCEYGVTDKGYRALKGLNADEVGKYLSVMAKTWGNIIQRTDIDLKTAPIRTPQELANLLTDDYVYVNFYPKK